MPPRARRGKAHQEAQQRKQEAMIDKHLSSLGRMIHDYSDMVKLLMKTVYKRKPGGLAPGGGGGGGGGGGDGDDTSSSEFGHLALPGWPPAPPPPPGRGPLPLKAAKRRKKC